MAFTPMSIRKWIIHVGHKQVNVVLVMLKGSLLQKLKRSNLMAMVTKSPPYMLAWTSKSFISPPAKSLIFLAALSPAIRLVWYGFDDGLGANPIEFITHFTGTWGIVFLCLTLAITPLRVSTGWNWLISYRRMLGLFCF